MSHLIAPSILSADFGNLARDIEMLNNSRADWIHCDIMDGNFVPNISFGMPVLKAVKKVTKLPMDVHLMIANPDQFLEDFKDAGADILTVQYEACPHLHRTLMRIRELGMKNGVVLNPGTPVECLREVISMIDVVLIMSVNPGFGGQKFITEACSKVARTRQMIQESGSHALIEVDGGVNADTGLKLIEAGADVLVAGSFVFKADNPGDQISLLKDLDPFTRSV